MLDRYETIGNVVLNYTYYQGEDLYTDGVIEDEMLQIAMNGGYEEHLKKDNRWPILYHFSDIRHNILDWYPMKSNASVLEIGSGCGAISGILCKKVRKVKAIELSKKRSLINGHRNKECDNLEIMVGNFEDIEVDEKFDYVTLIGVLEYGATYINSESPYVEMLKKANKFLKKGGEILIAIENKMGLKYFNGANEDHTSKPYSGINDYISTSSARTFSKRELCDLLEKAGIKEYQFFYPNPDYKLPDTIFSDGYLPGAGDIRNFKTNYDSDRMFEFNEAIAFDQICEDGQFDYFSNSYFIVCNKSDCEVVFAKYNRERKSRFRIKTEILKNGKQYIVKKTALNHESQEHLQKMEHNYQKICNLYTNVELLKGSFNGTAFVYDFFEGKNLTDRLFEFRHKADKFVKQAKEIMEFVYTHKIEHEQQFEMTEDFRQIFGDIIPQDAYSLRVTNVDYIFHNIKYVDNRFVTFDYEWVFQFPIPHEYVKWRSCNQLYSKYRMYLKPQISCLNFMEKLGFCREDISAYQNMERCFEQYVTGVNQQEIYTRNYCKKAYTNNLRIFY